MDRELRERLVSGWFDASDIQAALDETDRLETEVDRLRQGIRQAHPRRLGMGMQPYCGRCGGRIPWPCPTRQLL